MAMKIQMRDSRTQTLQVDQVGSGNPATLHVAADVPTRVVVRNVGAVTLFLTHKSVALQRTGQTNDAYQLPADQETTVVLAPGQGLYAAAGGVNGRASILVSEAIPVFLEN